MTRQGLAVLSVVAVILACSSSSPPNDGGAEAGIQPQHTTTHDCSAACGSSKYCALPSAGGFCPPPDSGTCPAGCPGCGPLPPPSCAALPAACNGTPTCDCLLTVCLGGCGSSKGSCAINADGDWVIGCTSC